MGEAGTKGPWRPNSLSAAGDTGSGHWSDSPCFPQEQRGRRVGKGLKKRGEVPRLGPPGYLQHFRAASSIRRAKRGQCLPLSRLPGLGWCFQYLCVHPLSPVPAASLMLPVFPSAGDRRQRGSQSRPLGAGVTELPKRRRGNLTETEGPSANLQPALDPTTSSGQNSRRRECAAPGPLSDF